LRNFYGKEYIRYYKQPKIIRSKYVDIFIPPFKNPDGDLDYGGIIKVKIYDSYLDFDNKPKKNKVIGGIND